MRRHLRATNSQSKGQAKLTRSGPRSLAFSDGVELTPSLRRTSSENKPETEERSTVSHELKSRRDTAYPAARILAAGALRTGSGCMRTRRRRCQAIEQQNVYHLCRETNSTGFSSPFLSPSPVFFVLFQRIFLFFFSFLPVTFRSGSRRRQRWRERPPSARRRRRRRAKRQFGRPNRPLTATPGVASPFSRRDFYTVLTLPVASRQQVYPSSDAHADMHEPLYSRYRYTTQE